MSVFCPIGGLGFISYQALLINHKRENYNKEDFDIWEIESGSRSIDSVLWDFGNICSNFNITHENTIKFFDEYMIMFKNNQIMNYEDELEEFVLDKIKLKLFE